MFKILIIILIIKICPLILCLQNCGKSEGSFRIVGGSEAKALQYPWMAFMRIRYIDNFNNTIFTKCGATLIDDQWLVTAAHCFDDAINSPAVNIFITLGARNLAEAESTQVFVEANKFILHPYYDPEDEEIAYDIAVIKLNEKLDLINKHKQLQPICLPSNETINKTNCYISGWGLTKPDGISSNVLMTANVTLITTQECRRYYFDLLESQVCAGAKGVDTCDGDSGGPLQCVLANGIWVLEGIASWGAYVCASGNPAVFTKVEKFVNWINQMKA